MMRSMSPVRLRQLLHYEADSGRFTWLPRANPMNERSINCWNGKHAGRAAGGIRADGYLSIMIEGKAYLAHRVAWAISTGEWPDFRIDHHNGILLDNRFSNLRPATHAQNMANTKKRADNTSGYKGVTLREGGRYEARIQADNKSRLLGRFDTAEKAYAAYCAAAAKLHGDYANFGGD